MTRIRVIALPTATCCTLEYLGLPAIKLPDDLAARTPKLAEPQA